MQRKKISLVLGLFFIFLFLLIAAFPVQANTTVFDDMEHGNPFGNGWFTFGGDVGGGGIGSNNTDVPLNEGGDFSLEAGWGSGNVPGFFGGFGRTNPTDLSGSDHFDFWINPDAGQDYTLEINLQDDDTGDDAAVNTDNDDEFQYNCVVSPTGPCAISGGGWQKVSIPLADFFDDNSLYTSGNGVLDAVPTASGGNGQLINVVFVVISNSGADVTFRTDYWSFSQRIVDDFENGLPSGVDGDGIPIGFNTFLDANENSSVSIAITDAPPAPVPGADPGNNVMALTGNVVAFGGFTHSFENEAVDTWVPQDWSNFEGIGFWLYGQNSVNGLFIDILDNRNPGSTSDDAERFVFNLTDDFAGWQYFELPFSSFVRKEVGNGAPNDGLNLTEVHGWALGMIGTEGEEYTYYVDDVFLYGVAEVPELAVTFSAAEYEVTEGSAAAVTVELTRELGVEADDPDAVSVNFSMEPGSAVPDRDYTPVSETLTFTPGGATEQIVTVPTFDNPKHDGDKTIILRLSDPVDIAPGFTMQAVLTILDDDPLDPTLLDDFERGPYLWHSEDVTLSTPEIAAGDPMAVPDQGAYEHVLQVDTAVTTAVGVDIVVNGNICNRGNGVVPVAILTTDYFDATSIDHNTVLFGDAMETHRDKKTDEAVRHAEDFDGDGDIDLVFHFRAKETGYACGETEFMLTGETFAGQPIVSSAEVSFGRDFPLGQDWTGAEALSFWFYGNNSGDAITLQLKDNRAPDPGPSGWELVWSDEFDEPAGTPPNPAHWSYEIGDGAVNGIPGWGNDELQYYTSSVENSATDGNGNLVITAAEADDSLTCYYGPCEYTSARLISQYKAEFAYGRIESRIKVPQGAGLWPAFWSLGTDIGEVGWPQTGEIDFMEFVGRVPTEIFGTIHGPGYSGGESFGGYYDFGAPVYNDFHTFAMEWEPDLIKWYVDGILYHTATPTDVAPNEWVFNDPVFLLLNVAVGGNFGGPVGEDTTFPQEMTIDYVRVLQAPDTAERWEATFIDNFEGWQRVVVPFASITRSANQPAGAPDDGLTLSDVWGYGFELPSGGTTTGKLWLDQVQLVPLGATVTNLNDSGAGSLRQALQDVGVGGTITFDPALADGTLLLTSGPLVPVKSVNIDAADAPGITIDGGGSDRVLVVDPGLTVNIANLTMTNGYGWQLAGGILNNGNLTLDHVTVTGNTMATDADDFWQGGGGIYNGEFATLHLIDSTVSNNTSGHDGGGIFSFFETTTLVERSTISGNTAQNVGGGIRMLGNADIVNSTVSSNESLTWHGGAMFLTDGIVDIVNSTITANTSPPGTAGIFSGTFGGPLPTLTLINTVMAANGDFGCIAFGGDPLALVVSDGNNVFTDGSCNPVASDQVVEDALLGPLNDNGGPTLTHALLPGSPAIDAANGSVCPATDQRGVSRPQGIGCDVGAFELD